MKSKITILLLVILLCVLQVNVCFASETVKKIVPNVDNYQDLKGHWGEEQMKNIIRYGIMNGTSATTASPDNHITRAEMCALMVRAFEPTKTTELTSYVDVSSEQWFYNYVSKAVAMGIINGNGNSIDPDGYITREDAAVIFYRAFNLVGYKENLSGFVDNDRISEYAKEAVSACCGAGIIKGDNGKLNPKQELTRAEFTAMLNRAANVYVNSITPMENKDVNGSLVISLPNSTINSITVSGNLYIVDGVGEGYVTLNNVKVGGNIYIRSGSKLYLKNNCSTSSIIVCGDISNLEIESDITCDINSTVISDAPKLLNLKGSLGNVTFNDSSSDTKVNLSNVDISTLNINAKINSLVLDKGSTIKNINILDKGSESKIEINCDVSSVTVKGEKSEITIKEKSKVTTLTLDGELNQAIIEGKVDSIILKGKRNALNLRSGCEVSKFDFSSSEFSLDINSDTESDDLKFNTAKMEKSVVIKGSDFEIGSKANSSKITFNSDTHLSELVVKGDNVSITVNKGANIDLITVLGSNLSLKGKGTVNKVIFKKDASGGYVDMNNINVTNNGGGSVEVGDSTLKRGDSAVVDKDGEITINRGDKDNTNNGNSGNSSNNDNSGSNYTRDSILQLQYAAQAYDADLDSSGNYSVSDFAIGLSYNDSSRKITGTLRYVENFVKVSEEHRTGYYVPFVLQSGDKQTSFTLEVAGKVFTIADVRRTNAFGNALVFFVPIDPLDSNKKINISYDADGFGSGYNQVIASIDYSEVKFEDNSDIATRISMFTGAPSFSENGEELKVTNIQNKGNHNFDVFMKAESLGKTKNTDDVEAYWGGVKIYAPLQASELTLKIDGIETVPPTIMSEWKEQNNYKYIYIYFDTEITQKSVVRLQWLNSGKTELGKEEVYNIDFTAVKRSDGTTQRPPDGKGDKPICTAINISTYPDKVLLEDTGKTASDFAEDYSVMDTQDTTFIYGTYNKISIDYNNINRPLGYYVPILVTLMGIEDNCRLYVGNTLLKNVDVKLGDAQAIYLLIPLTVIVDNVNDFTLTIKPMDVETYANKDKKIVCNGININSSKFRISAGGNDEGVKSFYSEEEYEELKKTDDSLTDKKYIPFSVKHLSNTYTITGVFKKYTFSLGNNQVVDYFAPIKIDRLAESVSDTKVKVKLVSFNNLNTEEYDFSIPYFLNEYQFMLPLGIVNEKGEYECYSNVTLEFVENSEVVGECSFDINTGSINLYVNKNN